MTIYNGYNIDPKGSMNQLPYILQKGLKVYIYTGDWDSVVPFTDTYKNLLRLNLRLQDDLKPWLINDQHVGFIRNYSYNVTVYQIKGAGHEAPLYQRERTYRMF